MTQFRQIIMLSGNHCDRLRAFTLVGGAKDQGEGGRNQAATHFPKLVKVPDSIR